MHHQQSRVSMKCQLHPQGGKVGSQSSEPFSQLLQQQICRLWMTKSVSAVGLRRKGNMRWSVLFEQSSKADRLSFFSFFKGTHSFLFTLEINFPPQCTNLAFSPTLRHFPPPPSCLKQETNRRGLCEPHRPHHHPLPTPQPPHTDLMLGDETGNRCHP